MRTTSAPSAALAPQGRPAPVVVRVQVLEHQDRVEPPRVDWEILDVFRDAAAECGIPKTDDFNRGTNEGCGYFEVTQKSGVRWTAAKGFLRPVRRRPNLLVQTEAQVKRLVIEGRRCTGDGIDTLTQNFHEHRIVGDLSNLSRIRLALDLGPSLTDRSTR